MRLATVQGSGFLAASVLLWCGSAGGGTSSFADVVKEVLATMEKLTTSLGTIKDDETAKAARPELRKTAATWVEIRHKAEKMKPPSQEEKEKLEKEFKEKLNLAQKKLFGEIARVKGVPGGKEALQEISSVLVKNSK